MGSNDAAILLLNRPVTELCQLLGLPQRQRKASFLREFVRLTSSNLSPDSQESAEAADLDEQRARQAYRTWRRLTPEQQNELLALVKETGGSSDDLEEEMRLQSPI
jgi:hypothetical protein